MLQTCFIFQAQTFSFRVLGLVFVSCIGLVFFMFYVDFLKSCVRVNCSCHSLRYCSYFKCLVTFRFMHLGSFVHQVVRKFLVVCVWLVFISYVWEVQFLYAYYQCCIPCLCIWFVRYVSLFDATRYFSLNVLGQWFILCVYLVILFDALSYLFEFMRQFSSFI